MTGRTAGHVPLYAGERVVGRAVETDDGWAAQLPDGTRLGTHRTLTEARAAVLARICRPLLPNSPATHAENLHDDRQSNSAASRRG